MLANVLFPNWLITVLLLLLLLFLTLKTFKKALSLHRCEVEYLAHKNAEDSGEQPQSPAAGAAAAAGGNAGGSKNAATAKTRAGACPGNNKVVDARGKGEELCVVLLGPVIWHITCGCSAFWVLVFR